MQTSRLNLIIKLFLVLFLGFSGQILAKEMTMTIESDNFTIREKVKAKFKGMEDSFYLKTSDTLPKGSVISYVTTNEVSKVLYTDDKGKYRRSKGSFIKIKVESIPSSKLGHLKYVVKEIYVSRSALNIGDTQTTAKVTPPTKTETKSASTQTNEASNETSNETSEAPAGPVSNEVRLTVDIENFSIREKVNAKFAGNTEDTFYLKTMGTLPVGTVISYLPANTVSQVLYTNDSGAFKRSKGSFLKIKIISVPSSRLGHLKYALKETYVSNTMIKTEKVPSTPTTTKSKPTTSSKPATSSNSTATSTTKVETSKPTSSDDNKVETTSSKNSSSTTTRKETPVRTEQEEVVEEDIFADGKERQIKVKEDNFSIREKSAAKFLGFPKDKFYLKLVEKLPAGTVVLVHPSNSLSRSLYNNDDGQIKRARGTFYKVEIVSIPGRRAVPLKYKLKTLYISKSVVRPNTTNTNNADMVSSKSLKELDLRVKIVDSSVLPDNAQSEFYLKKKISIPKGSHFSFNPKKILELPYYLSSTDEIKKSSGRYFGPLVFKSIPGKSAAEVASINKMKLYTFEKGISLEQMNKKLYSVNKKYDDISFKGKALWDKRSYAKNWSKMAKSLVLDNARVLIENPPSDIADYCPKYIEKSDEQRAEFWVHLMSVISKFESDFQPGRINDESAFGNNSEGVVSRGLLQISYRSVRSKRVKEMGCEIDSKMDLHSPEGNIKCGLSLFKVLTMEPGLNCISCTREVEVEAEADESEEGVEKQTEEEFAGIARYWSTLRPKYEVDCKVCSSGKATIGHKESVSKITRGLSICNQ